MNGNHDGNYLTTNATSMWKLKHDERVIVIPLYADRSSVIDIKVDKPIQGAFYDMLPKLTDKVSGRKWYIHVMAPHGSESIARKIWLKYPDTFWLDKINAGGLCACTIY